MKKKISLLVCILALVLSVAGCGNKNEVEYDAETLEQSCEQVLAVIQGGGISGSDISDMSEWNQGYLMAQFEGQTGVQMEASSLITALEGWEASFDECGEYEGHGDYTFKSSSTGVTVITEAEFSKRDAALEFTFDENLKLDAFTVGAHYGPGEVLQKAGLNTLLGMGTVFVVLIFMSFIISLLKYIPALFDKSSKKTAPAVPSPAPAPAAVPVAEEPEEDDTELIAVIAAAIAAAEGTSTDGFVVRSIKRRKSNKWNA
ncbi:OadG family transporter subunit [Roseburia hominis]